MIYFKSVLAGLQAVVIASVVLPICAIIGTIAYSIIHPPQEEGSIGWDPIILVRMNKRVWVIAVLIFCAGFIWEYRRLAR